MARTTTPHAPRFSARAFAQLLYTTAPRNALPLATAARIAARCITSRAYHWWDGRTGKTTPPLHPRAYDAAHWRTHCWPAATSPCVLLDRWARPRPLSSPVPTSLPLYRTLPPPPCLSRLLLLLTLRHRLTGRQRARGTRRWASPPVPVVGGDTRRAMGGAPPPPLADV